MPRYYIMKDLLDLLIFILVPIGAVGGLFALVQVFHYTFTGRWIL